MNDQTPTPPPLDLAALRRLAERGIRPSTDEALALIEYVEGLDSALDDEEPISIEDYRAAMRQTHTLTISSAQMGYLLDRLENAESAWNNWQVVGLAMQQRAEAAEAKIAAVRRDKAALARVRKLLSKCSLRGEVPCDELDAALDGAE